MINFTTVENNLLKKYKKKVFKQFPKAYLITTNTGKYTIVQDQEDLELIDVLAEFLIKPVNTPLKAWEIAHQASKTIQNLNRTNPLRIEGMNLENKISRANLRRDKAKAAQNTRKYID